MIVVIDTVNLIDPIVSQLNLDVSWRCQMRIMVMTAEQSGLTKSDTCPVYQHNSVIIVHERIWETVRILLTHKGPESRTIHGSVKRYFTFCGMKKHFNDITITTSATEVMFFFHLHWLVFCWHTHTHLGTFLRE